MHMPRKTLTGLVADGATIGRRNCSGTVQLELPAAAMEMSMVRREGCNWHLVPQLLQCRCVRPRAAVEAGPPAAPPASPPAPAPPAPPAPSPLFSTLRRAAAFSHPSHQRRKRETLER